MTLLPFVQLLIISINQCLSKQSLSPSSWANVAFTPSDDGFSLTDFHIPPHLPHFTHLPHFKTNGTVPIVGYYAGDVHIIDTFNNRTYYVDTTQEPPIWKTETIGEIPLDSSSLQLNPYSIPYSIPSTYDIVSLISGACATFKCYTQIEEYIYIIYDNNGYIIRYDLQKKEFEESIPFNYAGYYCLTNNGTHIFAIGNEPNILIIKPSLPSEDNNFKVTYSSDYIVTGDDEPFTCNIDKNNENIYIFTFYGVFEYSIINDQVSTIYNRDYYLPYNESNITLMSTRADNYIWIQSEQDQNIYAFSTETNRFLGCRVDGNSIKNHHMANSLVYIGDNLFKIGGINRELSFKTLPITQFNESINLTYFDPVGIDDITLIDIDFTDNRFIIGDFYHPYYPISINYTDGLAELGNVTDGFVQVDITSLDFNIEHIYIDIHTSVSETKGANDECEVCYYGSGLGKAYCASDDSVKDIRYFCLKDGLTADVFDIEQYIKDINENENENDLYDYDIKNIKYSIEAASTYQTVPQSTDPAFICNSFPIYPIYLMLNISLLSDKQFYLNINYEYKCNGCSINNFNDKQYAFSSEIELISESLGLNDITLQIINQESCIIIENSNEKQYACNNYSLETLNEIYFDGEYEIFLSSSDTFLEYSTTYLQLSSEMTECRVGTGYNSDTNSCHLCLDGTFSFHSDLRECVSCIGLDGVTCGGSNNILISFRYWVSGYRLSENKYISLYEINNGSSIENDDILISHICGFGQCCSQHNGCDYVTYFESSQLCSINRDITTAMCTSCIEGKYELLSTNDCGDCDYWDNIYYLIGTFSIAWILVLYLSFCDAKPLDIMIRHFRHRNDEIGSQDEDDESDEEISSSDYESDSSNSNSNSSGSSNNDNKEKEKEKEKDKSGPRKKKQKKSNKKKSYKQSKKEKEYETELQFSYFVADSYIANSVLIWQIFVYYFQGFGEILSYSGSRAFLSPIINFFNFNFANDKVGDDLNAGFCAIPYTNALNEIFMTLIFPFFMCFSLFIIYGFCHEGRCCRSNKYCTKPYVGIAFYRIGIIIIGIIFRVLMLLVTCTQLIDDNKDIDNDIDNELDHNGYQQFYYNDECFGAAWSVSLVTIVIFVLYFASIFKKLYHQTDEQRYSLVNKYNKLVQGYKNKYWYWEFIITMRRFIITMFVTLSFIGGGYSNLILCLLLIFFLIAHLTLYPFQHIRNNRIEAFCILAILIGFIGINFDDIANSLFLSLFLGIVIFMPILIAAYYFIKLCCHCYQYIDGNEEYYINSYSKKNHTQKLESMMTRVLHKRPSYFDDKNEKEINVLNVKPNQQYNTPNGDVEMVKVSYNTTKNRRNSDSSCGLHAGDIHFMGE